MEERGRPCALAWMGRRPRLVSRRTQCVLQTANTSTQKDAIDRGFLSIYVMCCWRRLVELDAVLQHQHPAHRRHHI